MIIPVEYNYIVTSPYGPRVLNGKKQNHKGIDFISDSGIRDVYSIADGIVTYDQDDYDEAKKWTDRHHSAGNMVIVRHELKDGLFYVRYLHLLENIVRKEQRVSEGEIIGEYANVGMSYGAHLHIDAYDMHWKPYNITLLFNSGGIIL
jgi:murein DD-endopeptidase MepM/ murein hydrolase activator NlpD